MRLQFTLFLIDLEDLNEALERLRCKVVDRGFPYPVVKVTGGRCPQPIEELIGHFLVSGPMILGLINDEYQQFMRRARSFGKGAVNESTDFTFLSSLDEFDD